MGDTLRRALQFSDALIYYFRGQFGSQRSTKLWIELLDVLENISAAMLIVLDVVLDKRRLIANRAQYKQRFKHGSARRQTFGVHTALSQNHHGLEGSSDPSVQQRCEQQSFVPTRDV
ncbi:MAG: hypothetical protein CRU78_03140 [Candidatus Accumulibacter phosphatis]|uniref:Uncharacterized protein n=1 Tax=Candidatus Accumulibacter phosphatis TaxID=327160 RepID=A0A6A7RPU7_9PROT|nr:hypothetical protein [Candidatus Accumulibacter phosphatis]